MSKEQILWCNDKIDWLRENKNDIITTIALCAPIFISGL